MSAPSLTGHGEKTHLLGPDVGLDTHIADVVGLLGEENLTDVVLVGHSYAGMVVAAVADRLPERVTGLAFVDAMVRPTVRASSTSCPTPSTCSTSRPVRLGDPVAAAIPRTYIHCVGSEPEGVTRRPVPAAQPHGAPSRVREVRSGHDCMVTVPGELAELLLEAGTG